MVKADLSASGDGHVDSVFGFAVTITAERDQDGTWSNWIISADSFYSMGVPILPILRRFDGCPDSSLPILRNCTSRTVLDSPAAAKGNCREGRAFTALLF